MDTLFNNSLQDVIITVERMADDEEYFIARNTLISILEEEPGFAPAHNLLGWLYMYHLSNEKQAEKHFWWSVKFDSSYMPAYLHLADMYLHNEQYDKLEKLIDKAIPVKGISKSFLYQNKGIAEEMKFNFSNTIKHYKKALFHSMSHYEINEIKNHLKRCKMKRIKKIFNYGFK